MNTCRWARHSPKRTALAADKARGKAIADTLVTTARPSSSAASRARARLRRALMSAECASARKASCAQKGRQRTHKA